MKTKRITLVAAVAFLPLAGFAQPNPPTPPQPPSPPEAPIPPDGHRHRAPKEPVIFLGVETSTIPSVLCEQMNLPKGFGLVVDYVVPDGPAAAAGLQQNDIIKMLNDQMLMEPRQLRKLLQTFQDGTTVTLTILRKGQEQKISVKLTKKEVSRRHALLGKDGDFDFNFDFGDMDFGNLDMDRFKERLQDFKQDLKDQLVDQRGVMHDAVMKANEEVRRAASEARRAADEVRVRSSNDGSLKTTKIDIGNAQIVFSDDKGEMKLETVDGKKVLTAKDPQGKLLFSGPVETKEELDKVPADVRQRFDKLQERDIPSVTFSDDDDDDSDANQNEDDNGSSMEQVSNHRAPRMTWFSGTMWI